MLPPPLPATTTAAKEGSLLSAIEWLSVPIGGIVIVAVIWHERECHIQSKTRLLANKHSSKPG